MLQLPPLAGEQEWVLNVIEAMSTPGQWAPPKVTRQYRPPRKTITEDQPDFIQFSLEMPDGKILGIYVRPDFATCGKPPVMGPVGAGGFGGLAAANTYAQFLDEHNPILVDLPGGGNSAPFGDLDGADLQNSVEYLLSVKSRLGIPSCGLVGRSLGGSVVLLAAAQLAAEGNPVPYYMAISPTLCRDDAEWSFGRAAVDALPDDKKALGEECYAALAQPVVARGLPVTAANIIDTYSDLLATPDTEVFMDAYMRICRWADVPYGELDSSFNRETLEKQVKLALRPGQSIDTLIAGIARGNAPQMRDFVRDPKVELKVSDFENESDFLNVDDQRTAMRDATYQIRNFAHMKIWVSGWRDNYGIGTSAVADAVTALANSPSKGFIAIGARDPLLPAGEASTWQALSPDVRVFDTDKHSFGDKGVKLAAFKWLEEQRFAQCIPDRDTRDAVIKARWAAWNDMGAAVMATNGDAARAAQVFMQTPRGSDVATFQAKLAELGTQPDITPKPSYELMRLTRLAQKKGLWLEQRQAAGQS